MRAFSAMFLCGVLVILSLQSAASAAISATVTYTSQLSSGNYQYNLTLNNTSTSSEPIGTFWFAWIPASASGNGYPYDFLPHTATNISSPSGWTGVFTVDGIPPQAGGGTIEWYDTGTALPAAQSLSGFSFTSPDSPDVIAGTSFFGGFPVSTSWVYQGVLQSGGNPSDQGSEVAPQAVPEPALCLLPLIGLFLPRRRTK